MITAVAPLLLCDTGKKQKKQNKKKVGGKR